MRLPQELVDEILNYLPLNDKEDYRPLRNCSLVAKSWTNSSRRHLFETVVIRKANRHLWLDKISPSNVDLLQHIRSLFLSGSEPLGLPALSKYDSDIDDLYTYFPSFRRLHTIDLCEMHISSDIPGRIEMFSACQQSLSSLIFAAVSLPWYSLIALIDYFPNLRYLELGSMSFEDTNRKTPPLSRPLRGRLSLYLSEEEHLAALSRWFAELEVEYEELMIDVGYVSGAHSQRVITACGKTLKHLKFGLREYLLSWAMLWTSADLTLKWVSPQLSTIVQNSVSWCSPHRIHKGTEPRFLPSLLRSLPLPPQTS